MGIGLILRFFGAYILLVLPGMFLAYFVFRGKSRIYLFLLGNALGIGLTVFLGYIACLINIKYFSYILGLEYAASLSFLVVNLKSNPVYLKFGRQGLIVAGLCLAVFISRMVPLFFSEYPRGWDPAFHTIIAQKILVEGKIPKDWMPFEPVKMNYTVGSHVFIALAAKYSGVPVHQVFKLCFPALAALTALGIYLLCLDFTGNAVTALLAAAVYSFLAKYGSLDYYNWGGLPNMLAMLFFLGVIILIFEPRSIRNIAVGGFFLAVMGMTHHLSALITVFIFVFYAAVLYIAAGRLNGSIMTFLYMCAFALIVGLFYVVPYAAKIMSLGYTSALRFRDEPIQLLPFIIKDMGILFALLSAAGVIFLLREAEGEKQFFLLYWSAALLLGFTALDHLYRSYNIFALKDNFSAFTPTRFLTDLVYPLSIAAGIFIEKAVARFKIKYAVTAFLVFSVLWSVPVIYKQCGNNSITAADAGFLNWVRQNTPAGSFISVAHAWAPYVTWRESLYTPLPASEDRSDPYLASKRGINSLDSYRQWLYAHGRKGYILLDSRYKSGGAGFAGLRPVSESGGQCLYEVLD
jgi:hypothetical protein